MNKSVRKAHSIGEAARAACLLLGGILVGESAAGAMTAPAPLVGVNGKEERAEKVWALRSGLNVAALQCQFSPFLGTVPTYNALLRQHSEEMADAFKQMTGYFISTQGPRVGARAFDTYATRSNQSWASFDGQVSFCNEAAMVARRALAVPKGQLAEFASIELPALRASLSQKQPQLLAPKLEWAAVPTLSDPCRGRSRCR